jgi:hypothetical protein
VDDELAVGISQATTATGSAAQQKHRLEAQIIEGDAEIATARLKLEERFHADDTEKNLALHVSSLLMFQTDLEQSLSSAQARATEQSAALGRLEQELESAAAAVLEATSRARTSRSCLEDKSSIHKERVVAADEAVLEQKVLAGRAQARWEATKAAAQALEERLAILKVEEIEKSRELVFHTEALKSFKLEVQEADATLSQSRSAAFEAEAELEKHELQTACHTGEQIIEVCCARENLALAEQLHNLKSRSTLSDPSAFAGLQQAAQHAAEVAAARLSEATRLQAELSATDGEQLRRFRESAAESKKEVVQREHALESMKARLSMRQRNVYEARISHGCAVEAVAVVAEELQMLRARVTGPLPKDVSEAKQRIAVTEEEAQQARVFADVAEQPLRHACEAEVVVLQQVKSRQARLADAVQEARLSVKEAQGLSNMVLNESDAAPKVVARTELSVAKASLEAHHIKQAELRKAATAKEVEWAAERGRLTAALHLVSLKFEQAEDEKHCCEELAKSLYVHDIMEVAP